MKSNGDHFEIKDYEVLEISVNQLAEMAENTPLPIPTLERIYKQNAGLDLLPLNQLPPYLPSPKSWKYTGETLKIKNAGLAVVGDPEFVQASKVLLLAIKDGYRPSVDRTEAPIQIRIVKIGELPEEGYKIKIVDRRVLISASSPKGALYGVQSFLAMMLPHF
ncbi:glycoside hydrolase family 20 zincin-like fold domain-containing protein [Algoriphagus boritolerans]|uniref:glycoside hydrolase family 20 zincin-like fold domain-containing protein n=1 Tax=Algoriphagus boritolerans TaxID=308111 RepID=UPI000A4F75E1